MRIVLFFWYSFMSHCWVRSAFSCSWRLRQTRTRRGPPCNVWRTCASGQCVCVCVLTAWLQFNDVQTIADFILRVFVSSRSPVLSLLSGLIIKESEDLESAGQLKEICSNCFRLTVSIPLPARSQLTMKNYPLSPNGVWLSLPPTQVFPHQ